MLDHEYRNNKYMERHVDQKYSGLNSFYNHLFHKYVRGNEQSLYWKNTTNNDILRYELYLLAQIDKEEAKKKQKTVNESASSEQLPFLEHKSFR